MLYLRTADGHLRIVVLETAQLDELKKGRPAKTPDGSVLIAWTPDPVWLADRVLDSNGDAELIAKAIDEASKRPEKPPGRPYHETHVRNFREGYAMFVQPADGSPMTEQNCGERITAMLMECVERLGNFPRAAVDPRAWGHLLVYAPSAEKRPAWVDAAAKECAAQVLVGEGERAFAEIIERHAREKP